MENPLRPDAQAEVYVALPDVPTVQGTTPTGGAGLDTFGGLKYDKPSTGAPYNPDIPDTTKYTLGESASAGVRQSYAYKAYQAARNDKFYHKDSTYNVLEDIKNATLDLTPDEEQFLGKSVSREQFNDRLQAVRDNRQDASIMAANPVTGFGASIATDVIPSIVVSLVTGGTAGVAGLGATARAATVGVVTAATEVGIAAAASESTNVTTGDYALIAGLGAIGAAADIGLTARQIKRVHTPPPSQLEARHAAVRAVDAEYGAAASAEAKATAALGVVEDTIQSNAVAKTGGILARVEAAYAQPTAKRVAAIKKAVALVGKRGTPALKKLRTNLLDELNSIRLQAAALDDAYEVAVPATASAIKQKRQFVQTRMVAIANEIDKLDVQFTDFITPAYARLVAATTAKNEILASGQKLTRTQAEELRSATKQYKDLLDGVTQADAMSGLQDALKLQYAEITKDIKYLEKNHKGKPWAMSDVAALKERLQNLTNMQKDLADYVQSQNWVKRVDKQTAQAHSFISSDEAIAIKEFGSGSALGKNLVQEQSNNLNAAWESRNTLPKGTSWLTRAADWLGSTRLMLTVRDRIANVAGAEFATRILGDTATSDFNSANHFAAAKRIAGQAQLNEFDKATARILGMDVWRDGTDRYNHARVALERETQEYLARLRTWTLEGGDKDSFDAAHNFSQQARDLADAYVQTGFATQRLKDLKLHHVAGAEAIEASPYYSPVHISFDMVMDVIHSGKATRQQMYDFLGRQLLYVNPDLKHLTSGYTIVPDVATPEQFLGREFLKTLEADTKNTQPLLTEAVIARMAQQLGKTTDEVTTAAEQAKAGIAGGGIAKRGYTQTRQAWDWNLRSESGHTLRDVLNPDMAHNLNLYNRATAGDIGLAKAGIYSVDEWETIVDELWESGKAGVAHKGDAPLTKEQFKDEMQFAQDVVYNRGLGEPVGDLAHSATILGSATTLGWGALWGLVEGVNVAVQHGIIDTVGAMMKSAPLLGTTTKGMQAGELGRLAQVLSMHGDSNHYIRRAVLMAADNHLIKSSGAHGWIQWAGQSIQALNLGNMIQRFWQRTHINVVIDHVEHLGKGDKGASKYFDFLVKSNYGDNAEGTRLLATWKDLSARYGADTDAWVKADDGVHVADVDVLHTILANEMDSVVIQPNAADMPKYLSTSTHAKVLLPFMTFVGQSFTKTTRRNLHRGGDIAVAQLIIAQAAATAMVIGVRNTMQGKEFDDHLGVKTAMNMSTLGMLGAVGGITAQLLAPDLSGQFNPSAPQWAALKSAGNALQTWTNAESTAQQNFDAAARLPFAAIFAGTKAVQAVMTE